MGVVTRQPNTRTTSFTKLQGMPPCAQSWIESLPILDLETAKKQVCLSLIGLAVFCTI